MNRPTIFLAYPISAVKDRDAVDVFVRALDRGFAAAGWHVRPNIAGRERSTPDADLASAGVLTSNVEGILSSDIVVIVAAGEAEPTSIWVEFGIALGAKIPLVLLAPYGRAIPFLARLAVDALSSPGWQAEYLQMPLPSTPAELASAVNLVVLAAQRWRR